VDIHQMQVVYDQRADRLLWHIRTRAGALYSVWLTRRLMLRLWAPFQKLVAEASVPQVGSGQAMAVPAAQAMMAEVARHKPLPGASFQAPFDAKVTSRPLGPEPLLPDNVELGPPPPAAGLPGSTGPAGSSGSPGSPNRPSTTLGSIATPASRGLIIRIREHEGRSLDMQLNDDLSNALMRLLEQALVASEWVTPATPEPAPAGMAMAPSVLN
jgi:hypothetical protein